MTKVRKSEIEASEFVANSRHNLLNLLRMRLHRSANIYPSEYHEIFVLAKSPEWLPISPNSRSPGSEQELPTSVFLLVLRVVPFRRSAPNTPF